MKHTTRWSTRFWRALPLLYLINAVFLLSFLSFPGNLVPATVFLVLGFTPLGIRKFVDEPLQQGAQEAS
ncbi:MAG: hypothetical protein ACFCVA_19140 [Gammaproteobacteria bacterium]